MWPFVENVTEFDVPLKDKVTYVSLINDVHHFPLQNKCTVDLLLDKIPELLDNSTNRCDGLLFMEAICKNSPNIYIHNWGKIVCGSLKLSDSIVVKELALRIFNQIVVNCSQEAVYSTTLSNVIPKILPLLMNVKDEGLDQSCRSLAICMKYVPDLLANHLMDIEKFLLQHMDSYSTETAESIGNCFAALPKCLLQCKNQKLKTYGEAWLNIFLKIINTVDDVLNKLTGTEENINLNGCSLFEINSSDDFGFMSKIRIFTSLCQCLTKMLSSDLGTMVNVPVEELLRCLSRVFNTAIFSKHSNHAISFLSLGFPLMYNAVFLVFEALISNVNILDQGDNFVQVLETSLSVVSTAKYSQSTMYQIKSVTWKIVTTWLKRYSTRGVYVISKSELLLNEMLNDIRSFDDENPKPKAKPGDKELVACCAQALKAWNMLFLNGAQFVEKQLVKQISTLVMNMTRTVQLSLGTSSCPFPYSDEKCRKRLYKLLMECTFYVDPVQSKCLGQAVNLFKLATKDPSSKVLLVCQKAFKLFRFYVNPKKAPPDLVLTAKHNVDHHQLQQPKPTESLVNTQEMFEAQAYTTNGHSEDMNIANEEHIPCQIESTYHEYENGDENEESERSQSPEYTEMNSYRTPKHSSHAEDGDSEEDDSYCEEDYNPADSTPQKTNNSLNRHVPPTDSDSAEMNAEISLCVDAESVVTKSFESDQNCVEIAEELPEELEELENGMEDSEEDDSESESEEADEIEDEEVTHGESEKRQSDFEEDTAVKRRKVESEIELVSVHESDDEKEIPLTNNNSENNNTNLSDEEIPEKAEIKTATQEILEEKDDSKQVLENKQDNPVLENQEERLENKEESRENKPEESLEKKQEESLQNKLDEDDEDPPFSPQPSFEEMCADFVLVEPMEVS